MSTYYITSIEYEKQGWLLPPWGIPLATSTLSEVLPSTEVILILLVRQYHHNGAIFHRLEISDKITHRNLAVIGITPLLNVKLRNVCQFAFSDNSIHKFASFLSSLYLRKTSFWNRSVYIKGSLSRMLILFESYVFWKLCSSRKEIQKSIRYTVVMQPL